VGTLTGHGIILEREHKISAKEILDYFESKHRKPRSDEECSKLVDQRKQAELQWLQDPSEGR
jgi:hypothetical protein